MKKKTLKHYNIQGLNKESLLGDAKVLNEKMSTHKLNAANNKSKLYTCLDLVDDQLALRVLVFKDNQLMDHSITKILSNDDKAYIYIDDNWTMKDIAFVQKDLEEQYKEHQMVKLNNLHALELNEILAYLLELGSDQNILRNLSTDKPKQDIIQYIAGDLSRIDNYPELLQAYRSFFKLHQELKNDELAKEYFSFGFKATYKEFQNFKHQLEKHCKIKINKDMKLKDIIPYDIDYRAIVLNLKNIYGDHYFTYKAADLFLTATLNHYHILSMFNEPSRVLEYIQTNVREFSKNTFSIKHLMLYIYDPKNQEQLLKDYVLLGLNENTHDILLASLLERLIYVSKKTYTNYDELFELYGKYHDQLKLNNNLDERFKGLDRHSIFDIIMPINIYEEYNKFNYIK